MEPNPTQLLDLYQDIDPSNNAPVYQNHSESQEMYAEDASLHIDLESLSEEGTPDWEHDTSQTQHGGSWMFKSSTTIARKKEEIPPETLPEPIPFAESPKGETVHGFLMKPCDEFLRFVLSTAKECSNPSILEILDVDGVAFAELIVERGKIGCTVFFENRMMLEYVDGLDDFIHTRLYLMSLSDMDRNPWAHDPSWDWSGVDLNAKQRRILSWWTARSLTQVVRSARADGATIRIRPIHLPRTHLLRFAPMEILMAMEEIRDQAPEDDPVLRFYETHAEEAQRGGLLRRDLHRPGAFCLTRMVYDPHTTWGFGDRRTFRMAAEELKVIQYHIGWGDSTVFQINVSEDGFWGIFSSEHRVAILRFPMSSLGLICNSANRFLP